MNIKALRAFSTAAILLLVATAASGAPDQLNWGSEVNPGQCDTAGKPLVSITQQVVNGVDSGIAGNYWAFDHYSSSRSTGGAGSIMGGSMERG